MSRILFLIGVATLALGVWLAAPLVQAYAADQVIWGRILDAVIVPAGDGRARFQVFFEYPVPGSGGRTWVQGCAQADARLDRHDNPQIPLAKAISLRHNLLEHYQRRVFLPANQAGSEAFIISEAVADGLGYRQGLFIALAGSLLMTMGIIARRRRGSA